MTIPPGWEEVPPDAVRITEGLTTYRRHDLGDGAVLHLRHIHAFGDPDILTGVITAEKVRAESTTARMNWPPDRGGD